MKLTCKILLTTLPLLAPLSTAQAHDTDQSLFNILIVGGEKVKSINDVPWQVALVDHGTRDQFCGGSIVADGWVLTAAHCVDDKLVNKNPAKLDVVAGTLTYAMGGEQITVSEIHVHPDWNPRTFDYDAALLKLSRVPSVGAPITMNTSATPLANGQEVRVSGWGATSQGGPGSPDLLYVDVPVVSNEVCNEPSSYDGEVTPEMFCAGLSAGGKDACQGDSGGPSDAKMGGHETLVGIVSWGHGCAQRLKYGVYTRVSKVSSWASGVIGR